MASVQWISGQVDYIYNQKEPLEFQKTNVFLHSFTLYMHTIFDIGSFLFSITLNFQNKVNPVSVTVTDEFALVTLTTS